MELKQPQDDPDKTTSVLNHRKMYCYVIIIIIIIQSEEQII